MTNGVQFLRISFVGLLLGWASGCSPEPPASQVWVISWHPECGLGTCGTNVTIVKGGAITQRDPAMSVPTFDGKCEYSAPITGQWSGRIFEFTMNGGGCGEQMQGFTQGDADGEYGTATSAHGTITWRFNNSGPITQTWTAYLLH
jgi:hypothetical protein